MRLNETIQFAIYNGTEWQDLTEGLITINAIRGCTTYSGPYSQPDVGQVQIVSRNADLDPYINTAVRYNNLIRITAAGVRIFTGKIDGIDVQYRAKDNPIITLTAIDFIGTMKKHILSTSFNDTYSNNWSTVTLLQSLGSTQEVKDFYTAAIVQDGTANVLSSIADGTTAWDAIALRAVTDLGFAYVDVNNWVNYYRVPVTDSLHPNNAREIKASFDYYGSGLSYQSINLNDGFENIVNQLDITGTHVSRPNTTTTTNITKTSNNSVNLWGKSNIGLNVLTTNSATISNISDAMFVEISNPVREVYEITYDASLYQDIAHTIDILDNININHVITDTVSINRKYSVVGIEHQIGYDYWRIKYTVKNWNFKTSSMATPEIHVSPTTGDQFTDWTFSYTIDPSETITDQYWTLGEGFTSTDETVTVNYANPGVKNVALTVTNVYGWQKTVTYPLTVGAAPPITSFTKSLIEYNRYQFTFTGQEAASYLWDFGNGKTSTQQNPITYYESATSVTVSLTATNAYGSTTVTQTFTPSIVTRLPIRYVKFITWNYNWNANESSTSSYTGIEKVLITGAPSTGTSVIDYRPQKRYLTTSVGYRDSYLRRVAAEQSTISSYLLDSTSGTLVYSPADNTQFIRDDSWFTVGSNPTHRYFVPADGSNYVDSSAFMFTVDLGQECFDISNFQINRQSKTVADGSFRVLVSQDNSTFYNAGYLYWTTGASSSTFVATTTFPVTRSWPTYDLTSNIKPVRYAKFVTNNTNFTLNEIVAASGIPYISTTSNNPFWGFGSLYEPNKTGARYFLGPNSASVSRYVNNVNYGTLYAGDEIPSILNTNAPGNYIVLNQSQPVEIIVDFGVEHYNLSGFSIDTRNYSGTATTTSANTISLYLSTDGNTWDFVDTLALQPTTPTRRFFIYQKRDFTYDGETTVRETHVVPFTNSNRVISKGSYG